jgi:BMFP domain-containing protein YqiC
MQKDSKLFEDFAKMASGAAGSLMDMRRELETMLSERLERLFAGERFVTRDEFEVVKAMAEKARAENAQLRAELDALKK